MVCRKCKKEFKNLKSFPCLSVEELSNYLRNLCKNCWKNKKFKNVLARNLKGTKRFIKAVKYYRKKISKNNARNALHRSVKLSATPNWVNTKKIELIYRNCQTISKETGIAHHVDHIVPLNNKIVCGLHVDWNLRIIPAEENIRKSNKLLNIM